MEELKRLQRLLLLRDISLIRLSSTLQKVIPKIISMEMDNDAPEEENTAFYETLKQRLVGTHVNQCGIRKQLQLKALRPVRLRACTQRCGLLLHPVPAPPHPSKVQTESCF